MITNGLLIHGERVLVDGLTIVGPGDDPSAMMDGGDYMLRGAHDWVRQIIVHTTKGDNVVVVDEPGHGGFGKLTADYWSKSAEGRKTHGGAQLVIDNDGTIWCLCDLAKIAAYHATTSNAWSIGIEMYQEPGGVVRRIVLETCVKLCRFLCKFFGIAYQVPSRIYNNDAMDRMKFNGGPDMVGVFGHRDNAWDFVRKTSSRGRGDPGDQIYSMLVLDGAEPLDFVAREDIRVNKARQNVLNAMHGAALLEDGVAGPGTMHAVEKYGYARLADVPQKVAA